MSLTFEDVLDDVLAPLDSLAELLQSSGRPDVAAVSAGLLRDSRARLLAAVAAARPECCPLPVRLEDLGGVYAAAPCPHCRKTKKEGNA